MGGTCSNNASNSEIATAILTIPQTVNTNNLTGRITYQYHYHHSSCAISGNYYEYDTMYHSDGTFTSFFRCDNCGAETSYNSNYQWNPANYTTHTCGYRCGYSEGQIIGATITY